MTLKSVCENNIDGCAAKSDLDIVVGQEVMIDSRGLKWYNGSV